ncbi:MAG: ribbon-helix-helix protein, CopG family [Gammaproteobacteria bacterium]|nr:ribbon-helix-helix protein, CopG family [Gammaproteobacteria bacterium]
MPTKNPRINITLEESIAGLLVQLAEQEHKSVSNIAKELVLEALERREDMVLSAIAKVRDVTKSKRIKHDDAWK